MVSALKALRVSDGEKLAKVRGRLVPLLAKVAWGAGDQPRVDVLIVNNNPPPRSADDCS